MSGTNDKKVCDEYDEEEEEDKKCPPNHHVSRSNPKEVQKKLDACLVYNEDEKEDTKCSPQQVPWSNKNEERADHKPGKHHADTHKHHKHKHKKQPSMESPNHQKAHRDFAQKYEESFTKEEDAFCEEKVKIKEAPDRHVPGSDPNERELSNEVRRTAHGASGGRHGVSSLIGPNASPGADAVDSRAHPPTNAQRRIITLPPIRPGAQRVPGPDNEGLDEDDEQMTVVSETSMPIVPEAERVNTEEDERRRQAAINQGIDDFIATAPVADVVPDNRGRWQKLVGAFLLVVIVIAILIGAVLGITQRPETVSPLGYGVLLSNVSSDGGEALRNSSTTQYMAFSWMVTNNQHLAAYSNEQIFQRYALATLFYSTNEKSWNVKTGWLIGSEECMGWHGTNCTTSTTSGTVSKLDLSDNNLRGTLPPEIGLLSKLEKLFLHANELKGMIPSEVGQLTKLTSLYLAQNELTGSIPSEIGMLSDSLDYLGLGANELEGPIPSEIGQLKNLTSLRLWNNKLIGTIPSEVWKLTKLTSLDISESKLTGTIPFKINSLVNLDSLYLYGNQFTGNYTCPKFVRYCWISCDFFNDEYTDACRTLYNEQRAAL